MIKVVGVSGAMAYCIFQTSAYNELIFGIVFGVHTHWSAFSNNLTPTFVIFIQFGAAAT